MQLGS